MGIFALMLFPLLPAAVAGPGVTLWHRRNYPDRADARRPGPRVALFVGTSISALCVAGTCFAVYLGLAGLRYSDAPDGIPQHVIRDTAIWVLVPAVSCIALAAAAALRGWVRGARWLAAGPVLVIPILPVVVPMLLILVGTLT